MNLIENHMVIGNANAFADADPHCASDLVKDPDWWDAKLEGVNAVTGALPMALARAMQSLDRACEGDQISIRAVLSALSILQRAAMVEAIEETEGELE